MAPSVGQVNHRTTSRTNIIWTTSYFRVPEAPGWLSLSKPIATEFDGEIRSDSIACEEADVMACVFRGCFWWTRTIFLMVHELGGPRTQYLLECNGSRLFVTCMRVILELGIKLGVLSRA